MSLYIGLEGEDRKGAIEIFEEQVEHPHSKLILSVEHISGAILPKNNTKGVQLCYEACLQGYTPAFYEVSSTLNIST